MIGRVTKRRIIYKAFFPQWKCLPSKSPKDHTPGEWFFFTHVFCQVGDKLGDCIWCATLRTILQRKFNLLCLIAFTLWKNLFSEDLMCTKLTEPSQSVNKASYLSLKSYKVNFTGFAFKWNIKPKYIWMVPELVSVNHPICHFIFCSGFTH